MRLKELEQPFETLLVEESGEYQLQVTLNRPDRANSLTTQMGRDLITVFSALEREPWHYRCVVFTGAGERVFCAGADLAERNGMDDEAFTRQHYLFERMMRAIYDCPVPIIAALNGATVAGGLELMLQCDFAYAVDTAKFGFPEVLRGIMPGGGGTQHLPRRIGSARAKEMVLTGRLFSAQDALEWGVVNRLVPAGQLMAEANATAATICRNAPLSTAQAKKSIAHGLQMDLRTSMYFEIEAYSRLIPTEDRREGIAAFNEKREAVFIGR
ncbi:MULTISPECIES: enoyl-CoA hydratase-related protein [unclassified Chelatococcus]|uniref:enoyl-CoA hydratase/isomerase family protein n=1 Tax=unclassified Chelatococcus TaxID=2638111 RepID=UPI001BCF2FFC|nr:MULTISPECIES: enoyl-CoA hydratase-related protein [unclassified Chelatococcus]MBS7701364.1 enoyl-CoA hydratase/isomerase family protein [Chelatococcus sp. YT9]MBX3557444.1 enoyl-CoA hydratase/isomerase family protein [Chelatococcus sp.]